MRQLLNFFTRLQRASPLTKHARRKLQRIATVAQVLSSIDRAPRDGGGGESYILMATFRSSIGLGHSARRLANALETAGKKIYTIDVTDDLGLAPIVPWTANPPPAGTQGTLVLCVQPPTLHRIFRARGTNDFVGRRWVGYWWWELERLPDAWMQIAVQMDELWCSSQFVHDCFARSIPDTRRRYVPLVIEDPVPSAKRLVDFSLRSNCYTVLSVFDLRSYASRKNPDGMIAAFKLAFGSRDDVQFIMKIGGGDKFPEELECLRAIVATSPNIRLLSETMSSADIFALIQRSDVFLSLHRSEGLGMVPAEAALLGTPIVATGWSGVMDFLDRSCAGLVDYSFVPVDQLDNLPAPPGSLWAEPDIADAASWLRRLKENPSLAAQMAVRARDLSRLVFSQAAFERAFKDPFVTGLRQYPTSKS